MDALTKQSIQPYLLDTADTGIVIIRFGSCVGYALGQVETLSFDTYADMIRHMSKSESSSIFLYWLSANNQYRYGIAEKV